MWRHISCLLLRSQHSAQQLLVNHACQNTHKIQAITVMKKIHRNFHKYRKKEQVTGKGYCRRKVFSNIMFHTKINPFVHCGKRQSYNDVNCRFYSSMKDDDMVKSWLNEIKDDFEKDSKVVVEKKNERNESSDESGNSDDSDSDTEGVRKTNTDDLHNDLENNLDKLEKLGFTTEEIIDLLKNAKKLDENVMDDEYELSDSESQENEQSKESGEVVNTAADTANGTKKGDSQMGEGESDANKMEKEEWAVVKMKPNEKTDWSVVEIEDFVNFAEAEPDIAEAWEPPVEFKRGKTGVYDIEDLVKVLRHANAQDVITIRIPPELDFADYMVIASGKSLRHIQAITSDVTWIYKQKKHKSDRMFRVEGEKSDWYAMDLGNIVLHIFMPATRELYDLETLWTVGTKFDPLSAEEPSDPYVFSVDDLPWLKELEQASGNSDQS